MFFMPLSVGIEAPLDYVFNILDDPEKNTVWNPATEEVKKITGKPNECTIKSFLGYFPTKKVAEGKNKITITVTDTTNTVLEELKYELVKGPDNITLVYGTVKIKGSRYTRVHQSVGRDLLANLKRYVEFKLAGGNDGDFQK